MAELKACPNFEVCGKKHPPDLMQCWGNKCLECDMFLRVDLTFVDGPTDCPVCLEDDCARGVVFPGGCTHVLCVSCFRELAYASCWHAADHSVDPVPFGAPPCPCEDRSCKSRPCTRATGDEAGDIARCEQDELAMKAWEESDPVAYKRWEQSEEFLEDAMHVSDTHELRCPLCRRDPSQNPARRWTSVREQHH